MKAAHIQIARGERQFEGRTGPKAAFDFYMAQTVPTAAETRETIADSGNRKVQFNTYCSLFGGQFGRVNGNGAVRSNKQVDEAREDILAALQGDPEATIKKLARLLGGKKAPVVQGRRETGVQVFDQEALDEAPTADTSVADSIVSRLAVASVPVEAPKAATKTERVLVANRISYPMAMAVLGFCRKQNWEFEITDKTGKGHNADYTIVVNGIALSPAEASEIIAASKSSKKR